MLVNSLDSPLLNLHSGAHFFYLSPGLGAAAPHTTLSYVKLSDGDPPRGNGLTFTSLSTSRKWKSHSTTHSGSVVLTDEERKTWDACRLALSALNFSSEEEDKILAKAFGLVHSPYWGEERKREVPQLDTVNSVVNYLRGLSLSDDDLSKILKKFPEVLGCSLEDDLKNNVQILEKVWGIKGKSLRNLILRNPKVLGYNVDCKGDCMAQCTRCWVRF